MVGPQDIHERAPYRQLSFDSGTELAKVHALACDGGHTSLPLAT
jgi:hypothetical protein